MKKHASLYLAGFISLITTVVCLGADGPVPNSPPATVAAPAATVSPQTPALSYGVSEVVKMFQGGINKDVLIGYIENTTLPCHLDADGIIYLQHLGLPQEVTSALLRRDGELQKQATAAYQQQQAAGAAGVAANNQTGVASVAAPMVIPSTPAPAVSPYLVAPAPAPTVVYPDYGVYPYYGYGYPYYGPDVVIAGGWGWGHGWDHGWGPGRGFAHGGFHH